MIALFKLTLTPLLIASASLAQRRWGGVVAGLMAGLPLTSAPVSVFLALEHGGAFAAHAAIATLLGTVAMSLFCAAYVHAARRWRWPVAALLASAASAAGFLAMATLPQTLGVAVSVAFPCLFGLIWIIGPAPAEQPSPPVASWDLPARMGVAALAVWLITAASSRIGPTWSGLLSTLPIFGFVMGVFSHRHGGAVAAHCVLRGFAVGALGAATFFSVVGAFIERLPLLAGYPIAIVAGLGVVALGQRRLGRSDVAG